MTETEFNTAVETIAAQSAEAQVAVTKRDNYLKMFATPEYQEIIQEGFYKEYPREAAEAIATNTGAYDDEQLMKAIKAPQQLSVYVFNIIAAGDAGEAALIHNAQALAQITDEMIEQDDMVEG